MTRNGIIQAILDSIVPKVETRVLTDAEVAERNRARGYWVCGQCRTETPAGTECPWCNTCPAGCMCDSCDSRR